MPADLSVALNHHRRGDLEEAGRGYRAILAERPEHPDANHLLGVLALQQGDLARAVELIGRAIALEPREPAYHGNLAEAHRLLGRPDRAVEGARTALRLRPDFPEAANTLGLALLALGRRDEAAARFEEALRLRPDFAAAANNLGNAHLARKDPEAAVAAFRRAVALDPGLAEAHSNLGQLLLERDEVDAALAHCEQAVRLRPDLAEAHSNLGNALRTRGRLVDAKRHYVEALVRAPQLAMVHNNLAQALQEEGRIDEAIARYGEALRIEPDSPRFLANLASARADLEEHDRAALGFEEALARDPDYVPALNGLGAARREQGRYDEARARFERALELDPEQATARCALGDLFEEQGDLAAAHACFRAVLDRDPRHVGALTQSATLLRDRLPDEEVAAMSRRLEDPELRDAGRSALHFALAHVLDARGDFVAAAAHLERANALAASEARRLDRGYDPAQHARLVDALRASGTPEAFAALAASGSESERPVFVFGLPRSGTTLTEQVLASHPRVHGAGELALAREAFEALPKTLGLDLAPAECLGRLDASAIRRLAGEHLDALAALDATADRVVDKLPENYLYLGLLAVLFPRARFIHCRRDLRDVAVSCWMTNFRQIRWANDPAQIADRFAKYAALMDHWRATLPVPILEVGYEDLVADLECQARRMLSFCGLGWDPACLAFHETRRPVRTASVTQVRRPIYNRSVARWRHYEPALAALFAALPESP